MLDDGLPTCGLACEEGPPMHPDVVSPIHASRPRPRAVTWLVLALAAIALVVVSCAGCTSTAEHKAFVQASRGFFDSVSPVFSAATIADPDLSEQSKKNRLGEVDAYGKALQAAEERIR